MIVRALLSVYDKRGLDAFARGLAGLGVELLASGGTSASLDEGGIAHVRIDSVTEFPELLGGRVKTLHPRIHAGILARRDQADDMASLAEPRHRPDRSRLREPLSVRRGRVAQGHARGGGGGDDRHRRPDAAPGGREELRPCGARVLAGAVRVGSRRARSRRASSRPPLAVLLPPRRSPTRRPTRRRS